MDRSSQEKNRSSQEQDPFSVILCGRKTPIPPPSWYHYPISSTTANQKILKPRNKFIIYRSHMHAERRYAECMDHAAGKRGVPERVLCAHIAKDWGDMSEREKQPYSEAAAWEEKMHRLRWPGCKHSEREPKPIETTEMRVKRTHLQAAQWKAEEARLKLGGDVAERARSGNTVDQNFLGPPSLIWQQPTSFCHSQESTSYTTAEYALRRSKKSHRKEDGHRVETTRSGDVVDQTPFESIPLFQQQLVSFGYAQGSSSHFLAAEVERQAGTACRTDDSRVESARSGNFGGQRYPELFLPFQQTSSSLGYSQ